MSEQPSSDAPDTRPASPESATQTPRKPRRPKPHGAAARRHAPKPPPPPLELPERTPDPEHLIVGRIAAAHGKGGEFRMVPITNYPEQLSALRTVYLGDAREPREVRQVRFQGNDVVVKLAGLTSVDDVLDRKGWLVWIAREDAIPLPEGEYYHYQLVGLDVFDTEGQFLGRLKEIIETGANDVYVVTGTTGELLLPAIERVIQQIDVENRRMIVKTPEYY